MEELVYSCRFYSQKCPSIKDVVMARIQGPSDLGIYVNLLEYNGAEGMVQISELSRRPIRFISKVVKAGRIECLSVTRVEQGKGYIDLSKRRVTPQDIVVCRERFARAKAVNSVLQQVAEILKYESDDEFESLYQKTAWYFDDKCKKMTASYDVFCKASLDPTVFDECDVDANTKNVLLSCVIQKLAWQPKKLRSVFEIGCYAYEGIDAIKKALLAGKACGTSEIPLNINLVSHPVFMMNCCASETEGRGVMELALNTIEETIVSMEGHFKLLSAPSAVTENGDQLIDEITSKLDQVSVGNFGDGDVYPDDEDKSD